MFIGHCSHIFLLSGVIHTRKVADIKGFTMEEVISNRCVFNLVIPCGSIQITYDHLILGHKVKQKQCGLFEGSFTVFFGVHKPSPILKLSFSDSSRQSGVENV